MPAKSSRSGNLSSVIQACVPVSNFLSLRWPADLGWYLSDFSNFRDRKFKRLMDAQYHLLPQLQPPVPNAREVAGWHTQNSANFGIVLF